MDTPEGSPSRAISSVIRAGSLLVWPLSALLSSYWKRTPESQRDVEMPTVFPDKHFHVKEIIKINTNDLESIGNFAKLKKTKELRMTYNIFKTGTGLQCAPDFSALKNLEILDLRGNHIMEIPETLFKLSSLRELNLENCNITNIPSSIEQLKNLEKLNLDNNKIKVPIFTRLCSLKYLSLSNNGIEYINAPLPEQLEALDISENFLQEIPDLVFEKCLCLLKLYARINYLKSLPSSICNLTCLKILEISKNEIRKLPDDIGKLQALVFMNISYNEFTALPKSISELKIPAGKIYCGENPLQKPPMEVAVLGLHSIKNFFEALDTSSELSSRRLKLMVLGDADAGKTSFAEAIVTCVEPDPEKNKTTIGIDFFTWKATPTEPDPLEILIIDCAGQKKYLLTHQLFLSVGMLYAIVVDLHKYDCSEKYFKEKIGFWIDLVIAKVPNAAIMFIPTKIDLITEDQVEERCNHILKSSKEHISERKRHLEKSNEGRTTKHKRLTHGIERDTRSMKERLRKRRKQLEEDEIRIKPTLPTSLLIDSPSDNNNGDTVENADNDDIIHMIPISNKHPLPGLQLLRKEIIRIAGNKIFCPNVDRRVPETWIWLEELCAAKRKQHVISVEDLMKEATWFKSRDEIHEALQYVDSVGPIVYLHKCNSDAVFLDPLWFLHLLKMVFRHDFETALTYDAKYGEHPHELFELQFKQDKYALIKNAFLSKKLLRCIWIDKISDDNLFHQVIQLLQKCDLMYDIKLLSLSNNDKHLLVPWFFKNECPAHEQLEPSDGQARIVTIMETRGVLPLGFFQRFIIKVHSLNILRSCIPWNSGFRAVVKDGEICCLHTKNSMSSNITLQGYSTSENIYHLWFAIIPILNELMRFLYADWSGIAFQLYSSCPLCMAKEQPGQTVWNLNLANVSDSDDCVCNYHKDIDKRLIYPPPGILYAIMKEEHSEESEERLKPLAEQLNLIEKDKLSQMLGDRSEELRCALEVPPGGLEPLHKFTNFGERVHTIIRQWEQNSEVASKGVFLTALEIMHPYPCDAADILLH